MIFSPSFCQVDLAAIAANFQSLGGPSRIMPVIKADAYGHGLLPVARTLASQGAMRFAVGTAREGAALRQEGHDQELVLLMGCHTPEDWQMAAECALTPIVGSREDVAAAQAAASGGKMRVAVKCDSGMGRLGFIPDEAASVIEMLRAAPSLDPVFVISHFACADMPEEWAYTEAQVAAFDLFFSALRSVFPQLDPSLGNSAASLQGRVSGIARPGLAIYGGDPFGPGEGRSLRWAMAVAAPIIHVRRLAAGQSVSYGKIFTAQRDMRVAVVACGYATGLSRSLSGRMEMLVNGRRLPQIGRICMGMAMLDVSDDPEARPGDLAWLLGGEAAPGESAVTPYEMASALNTIPYEILCQMGRMNERVYING